MSNINKRPEANTEASVEIDPSAPGTIVRGVFAAESVFNLYMAGPMIFNAKKAFEQMYLTDGKSAAPHAASILQIFGVNIFAMTVPMLLAIPNTPGAIELRRFTWQMVVAFEAVAVPVTLWQAWVAVEQGSGLNPDKLIWSLALPMGALLVFRAWVLWVQPEMMGKYRVKRVD